MHPSPDLLTSSITLFFVGIDAMHNVSKQYVTVVIAVSESDV